MIKFAIALMMLQGIWIGSGTQPVNTIHKERTYVAGNAEPTVIWLRSEVSDTPTRKEYLFLEIISASRGYVGRHLKIELTRKQYDEIRKELRGLNTSR